MDSFVISQITQRRISLTLFREFTKHNVEKLSVLQQTNATPSLYIFLPARHYVYLSICKPTGGTPYCRSENKNLHCLLFQEKSSIVHPQQRVLNTSERVWIQIQMNVIKISSKINTLTFASRVVDGGSYSVCVKIVCKLLHRQWEGRYIPINYY